MPISCQGPSISAPAQSSPCLAPLSNPEPWSDSTGTLNSISEEGCGPGYTTEQSNKGQASWETIPEPRNGDSRGLGRPRDQIFLPGPDLKSSAHAQCQGPLTKHGGDEMDMPQAPGSSCTSSPSPHDYGLPQSMRFLKTVTRSLSSATETLSDT